MIATSRRSSVRPGFYLVRKNGVHDTARLARLTVGGISRNGGGSCFGAWTVGLASVLRPWGVDWYLLKEKRRKYLIIKIRIRTRQ